MNDAKDLQHPRFARGYIRMSPEMEERGVAAHRRRTLAGLTGRVVEVGAGNGLNFAHYPDTVSGVLAVEPEDTLRAHAERAARQASVPVEVVDGHAGAVPAADGAYDAAVASLVLCSVPRQATALAELFRVLRPGGELRLYEHVRSGRAVVGLLQDAVTPLFAAMAGNCHPNRDTEAAVVRAGFVIESAERFGFSPGPGVPRLPHVLGVARRPG